MMVVRPQISDPGLDQLFSAPHVAVQLLGACQGAVFSPQALQKIVLQDSAFCAKVLETAVKSSPDQLDPGAPLSSALKTLSLPVIKSLAIHSAKRLVEADFTAEQAQLMRELWFHSQVGSIVSRCLAESISYPDPEEAQLAGLFLNLGMLALFSKNPGQYLAEVGSSLSSKEVQGREQVSFNTDHLQVADTLISGWQLETFMADAINFSHLPVEQCQEASTLIKIVRLALEVCKSPFTLNSETVLAADKLFSFTRSDTEYLFTRGEKLYRSLSPFDGDRQECLAEIGRVKKRMTSIVFSMAAQEGVRSQLSESEGLKSFVGTARHLYLQNSPARNAILFTADQQASRLNGLPSSDRDRLVAELSAPLTRDSLLAEALQGDKLCHSFDRDSFALSLFDRQLIRLGKGSGVVCLPLLVGGLQIGGVVLGLESKTELEVFTTPQMQVLTDSVARALAALSAVSRSSPDVELVGADVNLIPKLVHEVSNPLTIINNYMSVVGTMLQGTENEEILPAVENEIKRIREILKYYTEMKEKPQFPESAADPNELILSVVESLKPTFFQPKKIEILTDFDVSIQPLKTKALVIKQILVNLLKNAAEALGENGKIALTTREHTASDGQNYLNISVQDNGPGIDPEIQERLFSPVTSTKGGEHAGLGLNIVKGMVDDIGAKISCHSSSEFGTSFNLVIPRIDE